MSKCYEYPMSARDFEINCDDLPKVSASTEETTYRSAKKQLTVRRRLQASEVKSLSKEPVKFKLHSVRS